MKNELKGRRRKKETKEGGKVGRKEKGEEPGSFTNWVEAKNRREKVCRQRKV